MRHIKTAACLMAALWAGGILGGCGEVESRDRLWGVTSLSLMEDGTVVVADATEGNGAAMHMAGPAGEDVSRAVLRPGDTFRLWDGRHVAITYTFLGVQEGRALFRERTWHRPPDKPVKQAEQTETRISVAPYRFGG